MAWYNGLCLCIAVLVVGCSSTSKMNEVESQAQQHMAIADTLERASALKEATIEYTLVAELFPSTSVYVAAVRKAALLYSSPSNPAANDSASQFWLTKYLAFTESA